MFGNWGHRGVLSFSLMPQRVGEMFREIIIIVQFDNTAQFRRPGCSFQLRLAGKSLATNSRWIAQRILQDLLFKLDLVAEVAAEMATTMASVSICTSGLRNDTTLLWRQHTIGCTRSKLAPQ
jgi:sugar (pentulose or hexulose) kinase